MITSIEYHNFRVLRSAVLPLAQCTVIVGPNGSGKSTALLPLDVSRGGDLSYARLVSAGVQPPPDLVRVTIHWSESTPDLPTILHWERNPAQPTRTIPPDPTAQALRSRHAETLKTVRIFALSPGAIAASVQVEPSIELGRDGKNLAGVLELIQQREPERFDALVDEFCRWLPEYDRILLPTINTGQKRIRLRKSVGKYAIDAQDLSHGTLFALTLLTVAHLPNPPEIVCLEDVDHGLHPRLMRNVCDAMYRLAFPESSGESRKPVQVIATTHSPHLLDFFKDHPEEVVIAEKGETDATFRRLSDYPQISEILGGTSLGEAWFSGVLGGVPAGT